MAEIKAFVFQNVDKVLKKQKLATPQNVSPAAEKNAAPEKTTGSEITDIMKIEITEGTTRIVILDDDPSFTAAINRLLRTAGYVPYAVNDPDIVFPLIERVKPALIILDLKMPGTSGSFVAASLAQNPATKDIPIIILSGMISVYDQTMVKKSSGNQFFLAKSAEPATWLETIAKLIG